jgi:RNA polymerase sigma factor (TIGR02999 family)
MFLNTFFGACMSSRNSGDITVLLKAWSAGDAAALDRLTPRVYEELRRMSRRYMRAERMGHTLEPTALVNDLYLRLVDVSSAAWTDRVHFFAACAQMMRRMLVDSARARRSGKRGGPAPKVSIDDALVIAPERDSATVALDDALNELQEVDPRKARIVEMRYFGGMSVEETAAVLIVSPQTVMRDWKLAKAWLSSQIKNPAH